VVAGVPLFTCMARRKTLKKAEFTSFSNCFDPQTDHRGRWAEYFANPYPITLELGCGKAAFIYELAQRFPKRNFIGIDLKADRLWRPAKEALEAEIHNLAFLQINLLSIDEHFGENEVSEIWITFPDPFPKKRQAKHRMTNAHFLEKYESILRPDGHFFLKTDNLDLFHYSLEVLVNRKRVKLRDLSFDLHGNEQISKEAKVKTTYEKKFIEMGMKINYVSWEVAD